jgi:hypothetical protein
MKDESAVKTPVAIGTVMPDGTIYAGLSPTRHTPMYVAVATVTMTFNGAAAYADKLQVGDKKDFRLADIEELKAICALQDEGKLKGLFNASGAYPAGDYWSATTEPRSPIARTLRFSDGYEDFDYKLQKLSVCCVR